VAVCICCSIVSYIRKFFLLYLLGQTCTSLHMPSKKEVYATKFRVWDVNQHKLVVMGNEFNGGSMIDFESRVVEIMWKI
jgi:hypothetical protein